MAKELNIYYTSDTHGYLAPVDFASGKRKDAGLCNCMANFRKDGNTLVLDGGDTLQGSPMTYYLYNCREDGGETIASLFNLGGYDFVTLGNHDFNYGRETIERYLDALDAKCLCANVSGIRGVERTAIVTLANGLRVGLTGAVTAYVNLWERKENLEGITITDAFEAVKAALAELKAAGAELTVCIYHGGYEKDPKSGRTLSNPAENQGCRICEELDFDLLLAAHQHIAAANLTLSGTHTCQPPEKADKYLHVTATVNDDGSRSIRSELRPAGAVTLDQAKASIETLIKQTDAYLDAPLGHLDHALTPDTPLNMALHGSLIASLFNQVQLESSGADISCTCLGNSVRGFARTITVRDIVASYIYPNTLKTLEVDRAVLKAALERSMEYFTLDQNGCPQISESFLKPMPQHFNYDYFSGIEVTADLRRQVGERVLSIRYRGAELPEGYKLTLCMNNYRASGAGGYEAYATCPVVREQPTEIAEMILDFVRRHKYIRVDTTKWLQLRIGDWEF